MLSSGIVVISYDVKICSELFRSISLCPGATIFLSLFCEPNIDIEFPLCLKHLNGTHSQVCAYMLLNGFWMEAQQYHFLLSLLIFRSASLAYAPLY